MSKLILEFSEFQASGLNGSSNTFLRSEDPTLSYGAFDRYQDIIRVSIGRLSDIVGPLTNTSNFATLKSQLALKDQKVTSIKVLRIVKNNDYDVYVSFTVAGEEYYGVIYGLLTLNPTFQSEIFKDDSLVLTKEYIIRTGGSIIKNVKKWLNIEPGYYKLLSDEQTCYDVNTGQEKTIKKDDIIEVIKTIDNKIIIKFSKNFYSIVNDGFVYFNYWFTAIKQ